MIYLFIGVMSRQDLSDVFKVDLLKSITIYQKDPTSNIILPNHSFFNRTQYYLGLLNNPGIVNIAL